MQPHTSLPRPRRERWQPLRSGFVNLYRYDLEEFHYEDGRLLLRGNNGAGKSRVLALQLPFLLDGDVSPQRLEPDADPSKRVEWNLLMDRFPGRTGYTWIEFGRRDPNGEGSFLTLGAGLSAAQGQPVRQWFFITTQRIGERLQLITESRQVIGKERLREKIGESGGIYESAGLYRRAVDEALFGLGEYRYASLINLLIQLRRPQLTRRLDEHELSKALGEALPPVSQPLIATLADAFRDLELDRLQLNSSQAALAAVEQFLTAYRRYAEIAAKRRATDVLGAHQEYEAATKEVLAAEAECDRSLAELARLQSNLHRLSEEENALRAEIAAFQQNAQMHDAQALERAHREALERRRDAEAAAGELSDASRLRQAFADEHHRLSARVDQRRGELAAALSAAESAAASARLQDVHRKFFVALDSDVLSEATLAEVHGGLDAALQIQFDTLERARLVQEQLTSAKVDLDRAQADRDRISGLLADAREHLNVSREEHSNSVTTLLAAIADWTADLMELPLPFDDEFLRSVSDWCERPQGPNPFLAASRKALEDLTVTFAETRANLKQLEKSRTDELARLEAEHQRQLIAENPDDERILQLHRAIEEAQAQLDAVADSMDDLARREARLRSETDAAPADENVRAAYDYSLAVERHLDGMRRRAAEAEAYAAEKQAQLAQAASVYDREAAELSVGSVDDLNALKGRTLEYQLALASVWAAAQALQQDRAAADWAGMQLLDAAARHARQKTFTEELERRAAAAEVARDSARQAAGAASEEILQRISEARKRLDALHVEEQEARRRYHDTEVAVTRLDERLRNRTQMLSGQTDRRDAAGAALSAFASTGLLQLAARGIPIDPSSAAARPVELAFELSCRLDGVDAGDREWEEHQKSIPSQFNELLQALALHGCRSSAAFRTDVFVATAVFAGREFSMAEVAQALRDDVADRQKLLESRETEILENHLGGELARHLRDLLSSADEQVRQMNIELESRPTSTGMKLRFVWKLEDDAPGGAEEARRRLLQADDSWSAADRQMLASFLQRQIQSGWSDIDGAVWQESLAEALDYRKWHSFGIERYQDGVWKRLTRRTHGTGSGGEKAVALTLPHFAAAAAFYRTAHPLAPRLILLDEAFVGIDADMRSKCMGLIHAFDLDFMMTSEREWGCYPTLPGLAIYQLSTRPGIDAVGVTRWVWNGKQRRLADNGEPAAPGESARAASFAL